MKRQDLINELSNILESLPDSEVISSITLNENLTTPPSGAIRRGIKDWGVVTLSKSDNGCISRKIYNCYVTPGILKAHLIGEEYQA